MEVATSNILFSTGCPKCKVLKNMLDKNHIQYTVIDDVDVIIENGFSTVPILKISNHEMDFSQAIAWLNSIKEE